MNSEVLYFIRTARTRNKYHANDPIVEYYLAKAVAELAPSSDLEYEVAGRVDVDWKEAYDLNIHIPLKKKRWWRR